MTIDERHGRQLAAKPTGHAWLGARLLRRAPKSKPPHSLPLYPMVPCAQGDRRQREGRRVGEDCGGGARHPRGGMAELLGPDGGTPIASPTIPREPQAGDLGEEVGGSSTVGWGLGLQEEDKYYKMPESHEPDATVAGSTKRLASGCYQLKVGHCHNGQYLHWAKVRPTAQRWWCHWPP